MNRIKFKISYDSMYVIDLLAWKIRQSSKFNKCFKSGIKKFKISYDSMYVIDLLAWKIRQSSKFNKCFKSGIKNNFHVLDVSWKVEKGV